MIKTSAILAAVLAALSIASITGAHADDMMMKKHMMMKHHMMVKHHMMKKHMMHKAMVHHMMKKDM